MKTSYVFKNPDFTERELPEAIPSYQEDTQSVNPEFVELFFKLRRLRENIQELESNFVQDDSETQKTVSPEDNLEKQALLRKKKQKKLIAVGLVVLVVAIILVRCSMGKPNTDAIVQEVNRLYTSDEKVDVKESVTDEQLNPLYTKATEAKSENLIAELDTISNYLQAKTVLNNIDSEDYDLSHKDIPSTIDSIKQGIQSYTVTGLATTIQDKATAILTEVDDYANLKAELENMKIENYDDEKYSQLVASITHKPNREELEGILETIRTERGIADAKDQESKAKDKAEKKKAKQALKDAEKKDAEAQKKLDELQKRVDELDSNKKQESSDNSIDVPSKSNNSDNLQDKVLNKAKDAVTDGANVIKDKAQEKVEDEGGVIPYIESIFKKIKGIF